jgi:DNA-binding NarL/FixJ family response regulator
MTLARQPVSLRAFRSPDYRDLVAEAQSQGWDVYRTGSDHVAVVNPATGARVILTTTGSTSSGHALGNVRAQLVRAGLDLRSKTERRLERRKHKEQAMPKGQLLTEEQRTEIVTLRREGVPVKDIAERVGVSTKAVTVHTPDDLIHHPKGADRMQVTPEQMAKIAELRRAGKTVDEVAEVIGFSSATVSKYQPEELKKPSRYRSGPVVVVNPAPEKPAQDERTTEQTGAYPVIRNLVIKQRRYAKMLAEAEAMGDDDIQLMLLEKTKLNPLEAEAIRLYDAFQSESLNGSANGKAH